MKTTKQLIAAILLVALLIAAAPALAEGEITVSAVPECGSSLSRGDTVTYTFVFADVSAAVGWGTVRVSMAEGLDFQPDSIKQSIAAEQNGSICDLIPGNDGFVLLPEQLQAGDSVTISATVREDATLSRCLLETDQFTVEAEHPVLLPAAPATPVPEPQQEIVDIPQEQTTPVWPFIVGGILLAAAIVAVYYFREWFRIMFRRIKRKLRKNARKAKNKTTATEQQEKHAE